MHKKNLSAFSVSLSVLDLRPTPPRFEGQERETSISNVRISILRDNSSTLYILIFTRHFSFNNLNDIFKREGERSIRERHRDFKVKRETSIFNVRISLLRVQNSTTIHILILTRPQNKISKTILKVEREREL